MVLDVGQSVNDASQEDQIHLCASLSLTLPERKPQSDCSHGHQEISKVGDKEGALAGFRLLEKAKLGKVEAINPKRGQLW